MAMPAIRRRWTAAAVRALIDESRAWPRYELLAGELLVTPSPSWTHQRAVGRLLALVDAYTDAQEIGVAFASPADLELRPDSIMQPDVFVVPREVAELEEPSWPDVKSLLLAIEVLSPSNARVDRVQKRDFYLESGVAEYWIVDLDARLLERWTPRQETPTVERERLEWFPAGADAPFVLDLTEFFFAVTKKRYV